MFNLFLYILKHTFVIFPVHEMKELNLIEFTEIPTYIKFDLSRFSQNLTLNVIREVAVLVNCVHTLKQMLLFSVICTY